MNLKEKLLRFKQRHAHQAGEYLVAMETAVGADVYCEHKSLCANNVGLSIGFGSFAQALSDNTLTDDEIISSFRENIEHHKEKAKKCELGANAAHEPDEYARIKAEGSKHLGQAVAFETALTLFMEL